MRMRRSTQREPLSGSVSFAFLLKMTTRFQDYINCLICKKKRMQVTQIVFVSRIPLDHCLMVVKLTCSTLVAIQVEIHNRIYSRSEFVLRFHFDCIIGSLS